MFKKKDKPKIQEKIIDVEAGMQGNVKFNSPVNLKISGKFEGELETKGILTIGEHADVKAKKIKGENITIFGKVKGNIISTTRIELYPPAVIIGNIEAPILIINEGARLKGHCSIPAEDRKTEPKKYTKKKK